MLWSLGSVGDLDEVDGGRGVPEEAEDDAVLFFLFGFGVGLHGEWNQLEMGNGKEWIDLLIVAGPYFSTHSPNKMCVVLIINTTINDLRRTLEGHKR
jgi:hypothetical protein